MKMMMGVNSAAGSAAVGQSMHSAHAGTSFVAYSTCSCGKHRGRMSTLHIHLALAVMHFCAHILPTACTSSSNHASSVLACMHPCTHILPITYILPAPAATTMRHPFLATAFRVESAMRCDVRGCAGGGSSRAAQERGEGAGGGGGP